MRQVLGFDQWQLRNLQTESNSCCFLIFFPPPPPSDSHEKPTSGKQGKAQAAAGVTQLHPMDLGEAGLNCPQEVESHKRKVEAKTQAVWAATLYTLRGGKRPGKGDREVITTCSFLYTPARHIHLFLHLAELHHLETLQLSGFLFHMGCNLTSTSINCRGGAQMVLAEIWPSVTH